MSPCGLIMQSCFLNHYRLYHFKFEYQCVFCKRGTWSTRRFVFPAPRPSLTRVPSLSSFIIKITNLFREKAEIRSKKLFIHLTLLNPRRFFATTQRYWWETEDDVTGSRCDPGPTLMDRPPRHARVSLITLSWSSVNHERLSIWSWVRVDDRSRIKNRMMKFRRKWCAFKYLIRIWADS